MWFAEGVASEVNDFNEKYLPGGGWWGRWNTAIIWIVITRIVNNNIGIGSIGDQSQS